MAKETNTRLSVEQIRKVAKLSQDLKNTLATISKDIGSEPSQVRSAINSLRKAGVKIPRRPRVRSSKYELVASELK